MTDQATEEPAMPPWPAEEDYPTGDRPRVDQASVVDRLRSALLHGEAVENIPPPEPLIEGWLDLESLAVLYGRPNGGKSFLAIDWALHVATGSWWYGHEVVEGAVLYVAAEGRRGLGIRQRAWKDHHNLHAHHLDRMHWLPQAVNLLDPVAVTALVRVAEEIAPKLIVIDTLARSMTGGEENSGKDMGRVVEAADLIKKHTGACILLVHHTGKDQSAGARGHSSLLGALDTELELKSAENVLWLSTTKQKENGEQPPMRLMLVPAADSMAVARYRGRDVSEGALSSKHQVTLDALAAIDLGDGVSGTAWQESALEQGISKPTYYRHRKQLVDAGLVVSIGAGNRVRFAVGLPGGLLDQDDVA